MKCFAAMNHVIAYCFAVRYITYIRRIPGIIDIRGTHGRLCGINQEAGSAIHRPTRKLNCFKVVSGDVPMYR